MRTAGIVLAGGAARRMSGMDKPMLRVGGSSLLAHAIGALRGAEQMVDPVIVVGPRRPGVPGVGWAREDPPGGGPVAALAAGLAALPPGPAIVVVLAGDLIGIRSSTVDKLVGALAAEAGADGAVLVDADGRWQWLIGAWRGGPLHAALPSSPGGASIRKTLAPLTIVTVPESPGESADVDTPADLDRHRAVKDGQLTDSSQPSHRPSS